MSGANDTPASGLVASREDSRCQCQSIFGWSEGKQWQLENSPWFAVGMSLVMSVSGPHSNRLSDGLCISYFSGFCEVYIQSFLFSLQDFRKRRSFSVQ